MPIFQGDKAVTRRTLHAMNHIPGGLLVVFEGIDGAGKTTQAALLGQRFGEMGFPILSSKEPTGRPLGRKLRESARRGRLPLDEELALFVADRRDHVENVIAPALAENLVVILDRYYFSTAAYQGCRGASVPDILDLHAGFAPVPDLCFIMETPVADGLARIRRRGDQPNDFEKTESLEKCAAIFRSLDLPCIRRIDASADVADVQKQVLAEVYAAAKLKCADAPPQTLQALEWFVGRTGQMLGTTQKAMESSSAGPTVAP